MSTPAPASQPPPPPDVPRPAPPSGFVRVESKVEGITVYAPAPPPANLETATNFKCPNCGATTAFDPRAGSVTCSNCGSVYAIRAANVGRAAVASEFTLDVVNSTPRGWGSTRRELHCENCGANTSVAPTELATTCPFCGSNRVAARTGIPDAFRPRVLIPFKIARDQCVPLAQAWLARGWLYPRGLSAAARGAQFNGIYLPFWTFHAGVRASWRAEVGHERQERYFDVDAKAFKTRTKIDWEWRTGQASQIFDDQLATGTHHVSQALLDRLAPYDLNALVTYEPSFLAGWQAQVYEISLNDAWDSARARMREAMRAACLNQIDSPHVRNFSLNAAFDDETWRLVLLPAFIATYTFRGKPHQMVINGQTGKVAGDKPVAWTRIWGYVAALVLPGLAVSGLSLVLASQGRDTAGLLLLGAIMFILGAVGAVWILQQALRGSEA